MYKSFYNLRRNPFEITPDPSFLFPTYRHKEALAALYYGVRRHKGFVVLTGEVGTGKTLLVRWLLQLLKGTNIAYAYVFNSRLTSLEFLQFVAGDFGLVTSRKSKSDLLLDFGRFLIARHQQQLTTVLVVDEAHHLSAEVLEEIRLLTNLETAQEKLLQILLIGQPELDEKLDLPELRQLKQRIALRAQLEALDWEETCGYVQRRLQMAGAVTGSDLFPDETIGEIYRHSRGIPRLINTICENALITAYARQLRSVPVDIVKEVAREFRLNVTNRLQPENKLSHDEEDHQQAEGEMVRHHLFTRGIRSREAESPSATVPGASKHEPYI